MRQGSKNDELNSIDVNIDIRINAGTSLKKEKMLTGFEVYCNDVFSALFLYITEIDCDVWCLNRS
ncbi:hypothetical protein, partial [Salmonella sp. s54412]|uniref:hypothetical protein n=1 Tax=Salmonella sp. s54412 TaxID=3160128 RepID=UPI0037552298